MSRDSKAVHFLITARGGSKGVPRKNLALVDGIPLIVRSVNAALACSVPGSVNVSTDNDEIASVARAAGATVTKRPSELANDDSTSESAILHFLTTHCYETGTVVLIQPTAPFLTGEDLERVVQTCSSYDSCLTAYRSHAFLWRQSLDGRVTGVNHDFKVRLRRQDIAEVEYIENGAAYGMDISGFLVHRHRFFGRVGCVEVPRIRSIEIDSMDDLLLANTIAQHLAAR